MDAFLCNGCPMGSAPFGRTGQSIRFDNAVGEDEIDHLSVHALINTSDLP